MTRAILQTKGIDGINLQGREMTSQIVTDLKRWEEEAQDSNLGGKKSIMGRIFGCYKALFYFYVQVNKTLHQKTICCCSVRLFTTPMDHSMLEPLSSTISWGLLTLVFSASMTLVVRSTYPLLVKETI